jgi:hypothetical protein
MAPKRWAVLNSRNPESEPGMNLPKTMRIWTTLAGMLVVAGATQASLVNLGDGTVRDTVTNLIWLQDWNVNGAQEWATQDAWARNLAFAGSSDWVLPTNLDYVTLFAEFGDLTDPSLPFAGVQRDTYWSRTEVVPGGLAETFGPVRGLVGDTFESFRLYAVAVRPGDAVVAVPSPSTWTLVLLALGAAVSARKAAKAR